MWWSGGVGVLLVLFLSRSCVWGLVAAWLVWWCWVEIEAEVEDEDDNGKGGRAQVDGIGFIIASHYRGWNRMRQDRAG